MRAVALNPEADVCCVSIQSLHPSKDPAFEVFEGKAFGETLSLVYPLEHFPVASPDVKIDDLHHAMLQFWHAKNLGICEATKDSSGASSKKRERRPQLWAAFGGAFELGQYSVEDSGGGVVR